MICPRITRIGSSHDKASALLIVLGVLVVITVLTVLYSISARMERLLANVNSSGQKAEMLAQTARDHGVSVLREAIDAGGAITSAGVPSGKFWSIQPGMLTVFNVDGTSTKFDLVSAKSGTAAGLQKVDLNQPGYGGRPRLGYGKDGSVPAIEVGWLNVLGNPSEEPGPKNQIVGRYAFLVDDESCKVNLNAADGSVKGTSASYGAGFPTEISLESFVGISNSAAGVIAKQAVSKPLVTPTEIGIIPEISSDFYEQNRFDLTVWSRSEELNIFGEPKIYLTPASIPATAAAPVVNYMTGVYNRNNEKPPTIDSIQWQKASGEPLTQIYPTSSQLPNFVSSLVTPKVDVPLPQYFAYNEGFTNGDFSKANTQSYNIGLRIAQYLKGRNSRDQEIQWPVFPGASAGGFASKYTDRQIDSIALQIANMIECNTLADQNQLYSQPYVLRSGWLSKKLVVGLGRGPKVNEVYVEVTTAPGNPPQVQIKICIEWLLPGGYTGVNLAPISVYDWEYGTGRRNSSWNPYGRQYMLNVQDAPAQIDTFGSAVAGESMLGGYWANKMIRITDQDGADAGVDLFGNNPALPDPDQALAEQYHPETRKTDAGSIYFNKYMGSGPAATSGTGDSAVSTIAPVIAMQPFSSINTTGGWKPGDYHSSINRNYAMGYKMRSTGKPITSITLSGGIAIWTHARGGGFNTDIDPTPLDSWRGNYTKENVSSIRSEILDAVIPFPEGFTIPVPGRVTAVMYVRDPAVNKFPGDWVTDIGASPTMTIPASLSPSVYTNGDNPGFQQTGDPSALWNPEQSVSIPKSARFPSVGYLQFIRTGIMPDKEDENKPFKQQKGTPYRTLNFAPSTDSSQATSGGANYPDWAMLDLFTVPATCQAPTIENSPAQVMTGSAPKRDLTAGGSTMGRVNPNIVFGAVPGNVNHTKTLGSVFRGLPASGASDDASNLANAVEQYLGKLGRPFMMAAEIANVPEIAALQNNSGAKTRNEVIQKAIGNLSCRSNVFSIYVAAQSVQKKKGNADHGQFEEGDLVKSDLRMKYVVERYLDCGEERLPGNSNAAGPDGIAGTPDDPVDPKYQPTMTYPLPFKYRILWSEPLSQ